MGIAAATLLAACGDGATGSTGGTQASATGAPGTGAMEFALTGLPAATAAAITVTDVAGTARSVTASTTLSPLPVGQYGVAVDTVVTATGAYAPSFLTRSVTVSKGATERIAVAYTAVPTTGDLAVRVSMPDSTPAAVTITGPASFRASLTGSDTLTALAPGTYSIVATRVTGRTLYFSATPDSQVVTVAVGRTAAAAVTYVASGAVPSSAFNLQVLGMTLTQSVQTLTNSVSLITGRPAMLRVFAAANDTNSLKPDVRVRVYQGGTLVQTLTATTSGTRVPTTLANDSARASWNVVLPGTLVQPGLSILAEVDPSNAVPESSETDNRYPVTGTPQPFTVRAVPVLAVKFVPITQSSTLATGDVSAANAETFLQDTRDMLPVNTVTYSVREPYTTSQVLASDGTGWNTTLSELYALRTADKSTDNYYGVVKVPYRSGVAGMGYVGAPAALGWDQMPTGSSTMAHELGHNFGRQHAPCGGVTTSDAAFPYAGGLTGQVGFNMRTSALMPSSMNDLMGYCSPKWISDYNYSAMMNFRGFPTGADGATVSSGIATDGVLVWGRVEADGSIVLEPTVRITAPTVLPAQSGEYRITGRDAAGATLFSASFTPVAVSEELPGARGAHFAFVLPVDSAAHARLSRVTVTGRGRSAERTSQAATVLAASSADAASLSADRVRMQWNAAAYPMAVVRDATTGRILSFARGGDAAFASRRADVEVILSDGVRSVSTRVKVRGR